MRRRAGPNWFFVLPVDLGTKPRGEAIRERFETLTAADFRPQQKPLALRFRLADDTAMEEKRALRMDGMETISLELVKTEGFKDRLGLDRAVSDFVPLFDGKHTLEEMATTVSQSLDIPLAEAQIRCLQLARRLLQSSFVKMA